jgi:RNA polymerase sigma-70 factor (ECF subfamily)
MREQQSDQVTPEGRFREAITEVVSNIYPVIASQLGNFATTDDIADVAQSTWESAWRSRDKFDSSKGTLESWVIAIARRRAIDAFNQKLSQIEGQKAAEQLAKAGDRSEPGFSVETADPASQVIDSLDASHEVTAILRIVENVIQNPAAIARGLSLILIFDDDIDLAAATLGISHDSLRRSRRELILCCQVVANAREVVWQRRAQPVTLRTLIQCLPEFTEAGDWTRQLAVAVASAGGFEAVTIEHVMDVTGYSYHTARQYLVQSQHLIQVAATAIHHFQKVC